MAYNGANSNSQMPEEINPNNFVYYIMTDVNKEKDFDINEYVHPKTKKLVEHYLERLFNTNQRGRLYSKITNNDYPKKYMSENRLSDNNKCKYNTGSGTRLKPTTHKSSQTGWPNVSTDEEHRAISVVEEQSCLQKVSCMNKPTRLDREIIPITSKHVSNGSLNYLRHNKGNLVISNKRNGSMISNSINCVNEFEEKRKKLHVTKIGVDKNNSNGCIYMSKNANNKCSSSGAGRAMRYVNIKCNAKLQPIPINLHSLHSKTGPVGKSTDVDVRMRHKRDSFGSSVAAISNSCAVNSFCYSPVNRSKIHQTYTNRLPLTSKRVQVQELKTYSRKSSENKSCYLVSTISSTSTPSEQRLFINQIGNTTPDKLQKLHQSEDKIRTSPVLETKVNPNRSTAFSTTPLNKLKLDSVKCRVTLSNNANNLVSTSTAYNGIALTNVTYSRMTTPKSSSTENINVKVLSNNKNDTTINTVISTTDNKLLPCSTFIEYDCTQ